MTLSLNSTLTNERVLTGTANQVIITDNGANSTVVLSTPQNIDTAAAVAFASETLTKAGIAATTTQALAIQNTTAATSGVTLQYSPALDFIGHGWSTGLGGSDRTLRLRGEMRPVSAATATGIFYLMTSSDTGSASYTDRLSLTTGGNLYLLTAGAASAGQLTLGGSTAFSAVMETIVTTSTNKAGFGLIGAATDGSTDSTGGIGLCMIHNGSSNRQASFGDLADVAAGGTNPTLRFAFIAGTASIDAVTAGGTRKDLLFGNDTTRVSFGGGGYVGTSTFYMQDTRVGAAFYADTWVGGFNMLDFRTGGGGGTLWVGIDTNGSPFVNKAGIAVTTTRGLYLQNVTAATSGVTQQYSPRLDWSGTAWKSNATAVSQSIIVSAELRPQTGAAAATGNWVLMGSIAAGAYVDMLTVTTGGALTSAGSILATTTVTATTDVIGRQLTANGDNAGSASTNSLTNGTDTNSVATVGTILRRNSGTNAGNQSWIKIYVGTAARYIPVWD